MMRLAKKIGRVTCRVAALASLFAQLLVGHRLAPPQHRLGHDDGAVDEDAEVDRAERQQVRRTRG